MLSDIMSTANVSQSLHVSRLARVCVVILHLVSIDPVGSVRCGVHVLALEYLVRGKMCDRFSPISPVLVVGGVAWIVGVDSVWFFVGPLLNISIVKAFILYPSKSFPLFRNGTVCEIIPVLPDFWSPVVKKSMNISSTIRHSWSHSICFNSTDQEFEFGAELCAKFISSTEISIFLYHRSCCPEEFFGSRVVDKKKPYLGKYQR